MIRIKRVYICDGCGKVELPDLCFYDGMHHIPSGWRQIATKHLCKSCAYKLDKFEEMKRAENKNECLLD